METLGTINVKILVDILNAEKNATKFSASLKEVVIQQKKTGASAVQLQDKLQNIGLRFEGINAVVSILKNTFGDLVRSYNEQQVALDKLRNGLKNMNEGHAALNKLTQQASQLQKITPFADEEINNAQAMLTTFQKGSEEIEILTPRILDLAAAYSKSGESGMDLQQVAVMLGKVNEETIGGLRRVGVAFSKEQEEKLKSLQGTEQAIYLAGILDQNFKGIAETVGNTAAGKMKIFQNQVGELKEEWGKLLADALIPFLKPLGDLIKMLQDSPPNIKAAALALSGLGIAFVFLNGTMPTSLKVLGIFTTIVIALPEPIRGVAITIGILGAAMKVLGNDITSVSGLLKTFARLFPSAATAASSAGSAIARVFGSGGPIIVAIGLTIWWVSELIDKIADAQEEARQLERYRKAVSEGSFVPAYNPDAPGVQTLETYRKLLEKNPEEMITVEGNEIRLDAYVKTLEEADKKSQQFGKTWEEMTGQVNVNMEKQKLNLNQLAEEIEKYNEQMKNMTDPEDIANIRELRDKRLAEKKALDDLIDPPKDSGKTGKKPEYVEEFVSTLSKLNSELAEIQTRIASQTEGESITEGLFGKKKDIVDQIALIKQLNEIGVKGVIRERAIKEIIGIKLPEKRIISAPPPKPPEGTETEEEKRFQETFEQSLSLAQQVSNVLGLGADSFVTKLLGGLQEGLSLANSFAKLLSLILNVGSGGIFSLLGFASGGQVPGSGSGDTVPAMLTPGEFVIKKSVVNRIGNGFFEWLNGGTLFSSLAGRFASGGLVTAAGSGGIQVVVLESRVKGEDIVLSQTRSNNRTGRRTL